MGKYTNKDVRKEFKVSNPKINDLVLELIKDGLIRDYGKTVSGVGRRPNLYGLEPDSFFFIGIEVKQAYINIGLMDFQKNLIHTADKISYTLDNKPKSLQHFCSIINGFIIPLSIRPYNIL